MTYLAYTGRSAIRNVGAPYTVLGLPLPPGLTINISQGQPTGHPTKYTHWPFHNLTGSPPTPVHTEPPSHLYAFSPPQFCTHSAPSDTAHTYTQHTHNHNTHTALAPLYINSFILTFFFKLAMCKQNIGYYVRFFFFFRNQTYCPQKKNSNKKSQYSAFFYSHVQM